MYSRNPITRFSTRAGDYAHFRPTYPFEILEYLQSIASLTKETSIADVGAGTGIFTRLLLETGAIVYAVEPNDAMREVMVQDLGDYENIAILKGQAEALPLPESSIDLITIAQAFHWFEPEPTRAEFERVLKPGGRVALVWNSRQRSGTSFLKAYDDFLQEMCPEYTPELYMEYGGHSPADFLGLEDIQTFSTQNTQELDRAALEGRFLSSSYAPRREQPDYPHFQLRLRNLFDAHQERGLVGLFYDTIMVTGTFPS